MINTRKSLSNKSGQAHTSPIPDNIRVNPSKSGLKIKKSLYRESPRTKVSAFRFLAIPTLSPPCGRVHPNEPREKIRFSAPNLAFNQARASENSQ